MNAPRRRWMEVLRANRAAVLAAAALGVLGAGAVRWVVRQDRSPPPPRKVMQYTMVKVQPAPPPPKAPPPPVQPQKLVDEPQTTRVEIKATDLPPPDAPPPQASSAPAAGPLALAAEGEGPGDAFNLAGRPGGRGLLSGGSLGDGAGDGIGGGTSPAARYGWYYAQMASGLEEALRRVRRLSTSAARVEVRVWADPDGRVTRMKLVHSTGDAELDQAIESVVGVRVQAPPKDLPFPMIVRVTARRPQ